VAAVFSAVLATVTGAAAAPIAWHRDIQEAMRESARQQKPLLVSVGARWCGPCRKMHSETFPNSVVSAQLNSHFIPVLIDADEQPALVQKLGVEAYPTVLVISPDQTIVGRFTGFHSPPQLQARMAAFKPRVVESRPRLIEVAPRPSERQAAAGQFGATLRKPEEPYPQPPESREASRGVEGPRPQPPETLPPEAKVPFHRRAWAAIQAARAQSTLEAAEEFSVDR
jgi:thiol-disulfide isomerase/thioredoxin